MLLSLLPCATLMALWVDTRLLGNVRRPYNRPIYLDNGGVSGRVEVTFWKNGAHLWFGEYPHTAAGIYYRRWRIAGAYLEKWWGRAKGYEAQIPYWLLLSAAALPPACGAALLFIRRRRHPAGAAGFTILTGAPP